MKILRGTSVLAFTLPTSLLMLAACGDGEPDVPAVDTVDTAGAPGQDGVSPASADGTAGALTRRDPAPGAVDSESVDPMASMPPELREALQGKAVDPEQVVAQVGDDEIRQKEVDERLALVLSSRSGRPAKQAELAQMRPMLGPQIVDQLIDESLLDAEADSVGIDVSEAELKSEFEAELDTYLLVNDMTREDFEERLRKGEGRSLDEFLSERSRDEQFRRGMRHMRLLAQHYPGEADVTPEEIQARYTESLEELWSRPEMVRASHILIEPADESPEAVAAAQAEAESVRDLARAEDADFAALAREHSDGPTGPQGGDLGFFPREGAMVEPFAAAAFGLNVGEVSEPIRTEFGLHVIRVSERREAEVVPLDEAADTIRRMLEAEKLGALRDRRLADLKQKVEIRRS